MKSIEKAAEGDKVLLTCQSEGYPITSVVWQDGHLHTITSNTSAVLTPDRLFEVTSQILVSSSDENNYTCHFTNDGHSATFYIPGKTLFLLPFRRYLTASRQRFKISYERYKNQMRSKQTDNKSYWVPLYLHHYTFSKNMKENYSRIILI